MVNIVFACSDRKRAPPDPKLCVRALPVGAIDVLAREWVARLDAELEGSPGLPAYTLYTGVYWTAVRSLFTRAQTEGAAITIWVCSAGYGLIPLDAPLRPYSATFTPGHRDSVPGVVGPNGGDHSEAWWGALNSWKGPVRGAPRLLRDLVARTPDAAMVVVVGPHYLRAIRHDLRDAAAVIKDPRQLIILSAGASSDSPALRGLEAHLMRADSRWVTRLGGTRVALNGNLAAELLLRSGYQANKLPAARRSMEQEHSTLALHIMPKRVRQTRDEVATFIRVALRENPRMGHSVLLRRLRAEGKAFEYKRFRDIYNAVQEQAYALKV